ncbi:hypothetical protein [Picosynechococcus sp. PCC 7117]|uniref:hypothetical protein n=1 Tax=Picosynechococcus sp. PCC 7117 TaxID=195498 RepID=UPI0008107F4E|nr:hypothetical protein [Picosynechococcus sp. PCC 7117]ANV88492.1 hypothetical protein AWQ22_14050 [Picosynechococcus sp. PCC 7117]
MNIQTVRNDLRAFISSKVLIHAWDLDYPDVLYTVIDDQEYPANTAIELPVQNIFHVKDGRNSIKTSARFTYRIAYIFPEVMPFNDLPWRSLEGIVSTIHIKALLEPPGGIELILPAEIEDSLSVARSDDMSGDWLIYLNFGFDVTFRTTELPDVGDLQPPDISDFGTLQQLQIQVNRAKPEFSRLDNTTFNEDTVITITANDN